MIIKIRRQLTERETRVRDLLELSFFVLLVGWCTTMVVPKKGFQPRDAKAAALYTRLHHNMIFFITGDTFMICHTILSGTTLFMTPFMNKFSSSTSRYYNVFE